MIRPDIPYRTCCICTHIEDCPHPTVDDFGKPVPPNECYRRNEIKLTRRVDDMIPTEQDQN